MILDEHYQCTSDLAQRKECLLGNILERLTAIIGECGIDALFAEEVSQHEGMNESLKATYCCQRTIDVFDSKYSKFSKVLSISVRY